MKTNSTLQARHTHGKADYVGIAGSVLCLIHCVVTPVLALGGSFTAHDHLAGGVVDLDYFFILINGIAVYFATRDHKIPMLQRFLWASFGLFSFSLLLEPYNATFILLGYVGSGLLIAGHAINLIYCRPWRAIRGGMTGPSAR